MTTELDKIMARKAVAEQLINMLDNNVLNENGFEQFNGWCELSTKDKQVTYYGVFRHYSKEIQDECIRLMASIQSKVDDIAWILAPERED